MKGYLKRALLPALLALTACQPGVKATSEPLTATLLYEGRQCGDVAAARLTRIEGRAGLEALAQRLGRPGFATDSIDFDQRLVLLVEMGTRPTTGYGLALADKRVAVERGTASLSVAWQRPPPDAILAQMLTSPCLLLSLPRDDYERIEIVDNQGERRLALSLEP